MNKEFLGERRRALEEEYFAKLNRALIERLRAAEAADGKVGDAHGRGEGPISGSAVASSSAWAPSSIGR